MFTQQLAQFNDHVSDCPQVASWIGASWDEDQAVVPLATLIAAIGNDTEVGDVLGYYSTLFLLGLCEYLDVRQATKLCALGNCLDVVRAVAQLLGDRARVHLVDQEPQASASRALTHAAR
jgi:hypothetical protein